MGVDPCDRVSGSRETPLSFACSNIVEVPLKSIRVYQWVTSDYPFFFLEEDDRRTDPLSS